MIPIPIVFEFCIDWTELPGQLFGPDQEYLLVGGWVGACVTVTQKKKEEKAEFKTMMIWCLDTRVSCPRSGYRTLSYFPLWSLFWFFLSHTNTGLETRK